MVSFFDQRIRSARLRFEPGVAGLDDPATGAPARRVELQGDLLAAAAEVCCVAALGDKLAHGLVVVAAVEAESLRPAGRRLGPLDRDRVECGC